MTSSDVSAFDIEADMVHINDQYIDLWTTFAKHNQPETARYPVQYPSRMKRGSLLFVGCNPSFRAPDNIRSKTLPGLRQDMKEEDYFRWGQLSPAQFKEAERNFQDRITKDDMLKDQYFRILDKVCTASGMSRWEHIDLFGIRETKQTQVLQMLGIRSIGKDEEEIEEFHISEFAAIQVQIALEAVTLLEPLAVVVISAIASKVLKGYAKKSKLDLTFNDNLGTYIMTVAEKKTPVFLSGMLARQRALDVFSRERLTWHIRFAHAFKEAGT
jgi:hypothetical protein